MPAQSNEVTAQILARFAVCSFKFFEGAFLHFVASLVSCFSPVIWSCIVSWTWNRTQSSTECFIKKQNSLPFIPSYFSIFYYFPASLAHLSLFHHFLPLFLSWGQLSNQTICISKMQIFVKSLDRTFVVNVHEEADVADLKAAIEDVEFIPADCMRLTTGVYSSNSFQFHV